MASNALVKAQKKESKLEAQLTRLRQNYKGHIEDTVEKLVTVAGGAGAGYIDGKYPDLTYWGISAPMVAGMAASVVGVMGWAGRSSDMIGAAGAGMLAYEAGKAANEAAKAG